jgi:serine/threonine protein kinase
MHDDDARLLRVTRAISDGSTIDWAEIEQLAQETGEQALFAALRDVGQIAWFHRAQQLASGDTPGGAPARAGGASGDPVSAGGRRMATPPGGVPAIAAKALERWCHLELRQRLGDGVFGEVFLAWDPKLEREVALKLLRGVGAASAFPDSLTPHFLQEARNLARLRHPNIVSVFGAELAEGRVGIWMEYVRGQTLEDLLRERGPFGAREAALVGADLCRALTAVHRAGLVHRDVKAKNVMREEGGRIVLMDFGTGIDTALGSPGAGGIPAGTPVYLAPEIFRGQRATPLSDVYSLGVLLFHLVTGSFPAQGETLREIALMHERGALRLLREERPDLPEAFVQTVERALAGEPEKRFASAGQLEQALVATLA